MRRTCTLILLLVATVGTVSANPVEMMLVDRLDGNLDNYCLDIAGSKENANVDGGLQTHTCYGYQGAMGIDQMFDSNLLAERQLYMPEFDVCATLASFEPGSRVGLAPCSALESQAIVLTEEGHLSPVHASELCLTAGADTRRGRGGTSEHQIKNLTLELCTVERASFQRWQVRS